MADPRACASRIYNINISTTKGLQVTPISGFSFTWHEKPLKLAEKGGAVPFMCGTLSENEPEST